MLASPRANFLKSIKNHFFLTQFRSWESEGGISMSNIVDICGISKDNYINCIDLQYWRGNFASWHHVFIFFVGLQLGSAPWFELSAWCLRSPFGGQSSPLGGFEHSACGFVFSARVFQLYVKRFDLSALGFDLSARGFELSTWGFKLSARGSRSLGLDSSTWVFDFFAQGFKFSI